MVRYESNKAVALTRIQLVQHKALVIVGRQGIGFVKPLTPVRRGYLRSSMTFAVKGHRQAPTKEVGRKGKYKGKTITAQLNDTIEEPSESGVVVFGTNVDYAEHVEFGTVKHPEPRAMLRAGIYGNKEKLARTYAKGMRNGLR